MCDLWHMVKTQIQITQRMFHKSTPVRKTTKLYYKAVLQISFLQVDQSPNHFSEHLMIVSKLVKKRDQERNFMTGSITEFSRFFKWEYFCREPL